MSGRLVFTAVGLILLATAVVPPIGAYIVHRSRVQAATAVVTELAGALSRNRVRLAEMARSADVMCGSGRRPQASGPATEAWVTARRAAWVEADREDPWGNCYVLNLAAANRPGAAVWALSAGPDGIIDTPFFEAVETPADDDVGMRIR
jgi:hypothetical protein